MTYEYQPALPEIVTRVAAVPVIPGIRNPVEVRGAKEWVTMPIPAAFWTELRAQGLGRPDAPLPVIA